MDCSTISNEIFIWMPDIFLLQTKMLTCTFWLTSRGTVLMLCHVILHTKSGAKLWVLYDKFNSSLVRRCFSV